MREGEKGSVSDGRREQRGEKAAGVDDRVRRVSVNEDPRLAA